MRAHGRSKWVGVCRFLFMITHSPQELNWALAGTTLDTTCPSQKPAVLIRGAQMTCDRQPVTAMVGKLDG